MFAWRTFPHGTGASPGAYLTVPDLARRGIGVAFTTRHGGHSSDPYSSLNLSYSSGDDPATVARNRTLILGALGGGLESWTGARQVHGSRAEHVGERERGAGWDSPARVIPDADALWTDQPDVAVVVLTADCTPILLVDAGRRRIGAVHAGWRGLLGGVVEEAVEAMGGPAGLRAFIGPSIGPCCYEVGDDVTGPAADRLGADVIRSGNGKDHLDLWTGSIRALARAGVREVWPAALCTRCEPERFYSHRAGAKGRQGLIARLAGPG
jgi:purine-nucleoside/S-methyl-5'-thioadenosine phosphorylase / adenosine deaminase